MSAKRLVKIVGIYVHITKSGRGVGLVRREIRDSKTEEVLKTGKYCSPLKRYAAIQGWVLEVKKR